MNKKTISKSIKWAVIIFLSVIFWFISLPTILIWYVWEKTKLDSSEKWKATGLIVLIFLLLFGFFSSLNSNPPDITITEPAIGFSTENRTTTIKGKVEPKTSVLKINEQQINIDSSNGEFTYDAELSNEINTFKLVATNGETSEKEIVIKRILSAEEKAQLEKDRAEAEANRKAARREILIKELNTQITNLKNYKPAIARDSVLIIQSEIITLDIYKKSIIEAKQFDDPEVRRLGGILESVLINVYSREFPAMRKSYSNIMDKALWEQNVSVSTSGNGNSVLALTGVVFADNKNIKDFHSPIQEILSLLRFKRVEYRWITNAPEYTYLNIESKKDTEL